MNSPTDVAGYHCKRLEELRSQRAPYEPIWNDITDLVLPSKGTYTYGEHRNDPGRNTVKRQDPTAVVAASALSARIVSDLTGEGSTWFTLRAPDPEIDKLDHVRRALQILSEKVLGLLRDSSFRLAHLELTTNVICYGTACMFVQEQNGRMIHKTIPIQEICIAENVEGVVDTVYRQFKLSLRQAVQLWGLENLPDSWQHEITSHPDKEVEILHVVVPNADYVPDNPIAEFLPYSSLYLSVGHKHLIHKGFLDRMPYKVVRFYKRSGEVFGAGPAFEAMPDIKTLQALRYSNTSRMQLEAHPPIAMPHKAAVAPLKVIPNGINIVEFGPNGRPLIDRLLPPGSNQQMAQTEMEHLRMAIRSAFFVDPLINRENSIRTAAEVVRRTNEEMIGTAPFISRFQAEYLNEVIDDNLDFVLRTHTFPDPVTGEEVPLLNLLPPELHGVRPLVEYTSPLARVQHMQELNNLVQFLQIMQPLFAVDPSLVMHFDLNNYMRTIADKLSIPLEVIVPPEVVQAQKQAAEQQRQQQEMMQAAQMMGDQVQGLAKSGLINREDFGLPPTIAEE